MVLRKLLEVFNEQDKLHGRPLLDKHNHKGKLEYQLFKRINQMILWALYFQKPQGKVRKVLLSSLHKRVMQKVSKHSLTLVKVNSRKLIMIIANRIATFHI